MTKPILSRLERAVVRAVIAAGPVVRVFRVKPKPPAEFRAYYVEAPSESHARAKIPAGLDSEVEFVFAYIPAARRRRRRR